MQSEPCQPGVRGRPESLSSRLVLPRTALGSPADSIPELKGKGERASQRKVTPRRGCVFDGGQVWVSSARKLENGQVFCIDLYLIGF